LNTFEGTWFEFNGTLRFKYSFVVMAR